MRARLSKLLRLHTMTAEQEKAVQPLAYAMKFLGGLYIILGVVMVLRG